MPSSFPGPSPLCSIQNGGSGGEAPGKGSQNTPKTFEAFCRIKHDEIHVFVCFEQRFQLARKQTLPLIAEKDLLKRHFTVFHVTKYSPIRRFCPEGFSSPARHFESEEGFGNVMWECIFSLLVIETAYKFDF